MLRKISSDRKRESTPKRAVRRRLKSFPRLWPDDTKHIPRTFEMRPTDAMTSVAYPLTIN